MDGIECTQCGVVGRVGFVDEECCLSLEVWGYPKIRDGVECCFRFSSSSRVLGFFECSESRVIRDLGVTRNFLATQSFSRVLE